MTSKALFELCLRVALLSDIERTSHIQYSLNYKLFIIAFIILDETLLKDFVGIMG